MKLIQLKSVFVLKLLSTRAQEFKNLIITARTHNVAAQPTTLGKRFAMFGEELMQAVLNLNNLIEKYPLRGIKGAVGTLLDQKTLFNGDLGKLNKFQQFIAGYLGFNNVLNAVGQVYPRSLDFEVVSSLIQLASAPASFCKTLRIMAGHETATEGFQKGQVGSSAMPHKMNSRNCERVNGFFAILSGYLTMTNHLAGDQWNEGDVSCSVVRRVALPDAFYAIDGLLETFITILNEIKIFTETVEAETARYLPFLITTTILMEAIKKGIGRETAHEIIKKHSVSVINDLRNNKIKNNDLLSRLANDSDFPLSETQLKEIINNSSEYLGCADEQVNIFSKQTENLINLFPDALKIKPGIVI